MMKPPGKTNSADSERALRSLAIAMLVGLASLPVYAAQTGLRSAFLSVWSVGVMLAGASAFSGGVLGFLFGIPRTLQADRPSSDNAAEKEEGSTGSVGYRANTNLEQISDWLTKILVGVGLTQIGTIRTNIGALTAYVAPGLGARPDSQVFALALLIYFVVLGFLFGYLWTRLYLAGAMRVADQAAIGALVHEVQRVKEKAERADQQLEAIKRQTELDANALNVAYRQLNPMPNLPEITQNELNTAIAAASGPIKVQVFNQAWKIRSENWREHATKPTMERSIPIFRALIDSDTQGRYHLNHGQLGFALKDQRSPDWAQAEKEITKAIDMRGDWRQGGWLFDEYNRAFCRIMQDPGFRQDLPSEATLAAAILSDLKIAAEAPELKKLILADPDFQKWLSLNHIGKKDL